MISLLNIGIDVKSSLPASCLVPPQARSTAARCAAACVLRHCASGVGQHTRARARTHLTGSVSLLKQNGCGLSVVVCVEVVVVAVVLDVAADAALLACAAAAVLAVAAATVEAADCCSGTTTAACTQHSIHCS